VVCRLRSKGGSQVQLVLLIPAIVTLCGAGTTFAATINSEASSPQRPIAANTTPVANTPARPRPAVPVAAPRQVIVPVLGRETPIVRSISPAPRSVAAATPTPKPPTVSPGRTPQTSAPQARPAVPAAPVARQIAINASEPALTPAVRMADVAGYQKIGAPYQVGGIWYVPAHEPDYDETGTASWYGNEFHGRPTANGEIFDMNIVSGAHPTLPIPSLVEVTNLANGRSIIVRINDRGPFVGNRLIDMSSRGAELLGFRNQGHTQVRVRYVGPADAARVVTPQSLTEPVRLASTTGTKPLNNATPPLPPTQMAGGSQSAGAAAGEAFVQVGAFAVAANAQRMADQAQGLGPVRVVEATSGDGSPLYRVVLGPVANRAEALAKVQEMNEQGFTNARVMASLN
jgi:rare lipoprotein A